MPPRISDTHFNCGHARSEENSEPDGRGYRRCRMCRRERERRRRAEAKAGIVTVKTKGLQANAAAERVLRAGDCDRQIPDVQLYEAVIRQGYRDLRVTREGNIRGQWVTPELDLTSSPTVMTIYEALGIEPEWAVKQAQHASRCWHG